MSKHRNIHPDFLFLLGFKSQTIMDLFADLRTFILDIHPDSNELLYHTHALTTVFSISEKLSDAFCMIPIYTNHLHLGFNKGTLLEDPLGLLQGTGKLIRHIPVTKPVDYRNPDTEQLVRAAIRFSLADTETKNRPSGKTISKIVLSK